MPADGWLVRQARKVEEQAQFRSLWLVRAAYAVIAEHTAPPLEAPCVHRFADFPQYKAMGARPREVCGLPANAGIHAYAHSHPGLWSHDFEAPPLEAPEPMRNCLERIEEYTRRKVRSFDMNSIHEVARVGLGMDFDNEWARNAEPITEASARYKAAAQAGRDAIAFLRSCVDSRESLSLADRAMIMRAFDGLGDDGIFVVKAIEEAAPSEAEERADAESREMG